MYISAVPLYYKKQLYIYKCGGLCWYVVGVKGQLIISFPLAWRERQLPFFGMQEFLWFFRMLECPSIPYLQAFVVKHAM